MNNKTLIMMMAKKVHETKDNKEAARLLDTGEWIIIGAAYQGDEILWILTKVD